MNVKDILLSIIILTILIACIFHETKQVSPYSKAYFKGKSRKDDNIATLLDRISWVSRYKDRFSILPRLILISVISSFVVCTFVYKNKTNPRSIVLITIILFSIYYFIYNYYQFHADIFPTYYTQTNVDIIKEKLKIKESNILQESDDKVHHREIAAYNATL